jgi:uncharacterized membrane protein YqgA involved in biofilm formation
MLWMISGTLINLATVLAGSSLGLLVGSRLPARMSSTVMHALGLVTMVIGFQMALSTRNILILMGSTLVGAVVGETLNLEGGLESVGNRLRARFASGQSTFTEAFVTSSIVFCVGPMAFLGSIQNGLTGDYRLLAMKALLDGFSSFAFAATLGPGVLFSSITILVYQGGLSLGAGLFRSVLTDAMVTEMTAVGGAIVLGVGVRLLGLKAELKVANLLPGIIVAPVVVAAIPLLQTLLPVP